MSFRTSQGSATSAGTGRVFQAIATDLEVIVSKQLGTPDFYIGGTETVDQYSGYLVTDGAQLHFNLRTDDELWIRGTDSTTSSIAQALIRTTIVS